MYVCHSRIKVLYQSAMEKVIYISKDKIDISPVKKEPCVSAHFKKTYSGRITLDYTKKVESWMREQRLQFQRTKKGLRKAMQQHYEVLVWAYDYENKCDVCYRIMSLKALNMFRFMPFIPRYDIYKDGKQYFIKKGKICC